jgi:SAM-dependent methyltransferase
MGEGSDLVDPGGMRARGYQREYSTRFPGVLEQAYKAEQALRLVAVVDAALPLRRRRALDLGCSAGLAARELCGRFALVVAIDLDEQAVQHASSLLPSNGSALVGDGLRLPFPDGCFDAILCSQVYEHVPDPTLLAAEIERVLARDGIVCLGATNRWIVLEPHYRLPLLSWLPRHWADAYLRRCRGVDSYYERLLSYRQLRGLFQRFQIEDFTVRMVQDSDRFHCRDLVRPFGPLRRLPAAWLTRALPLFPSWVWILRKRAAAADAAQP